MPQDNNPNKEHKENINAVNYNPNRPNQGESDNKTQQGVSANSSTKKAVDTAAKAVANRFAPGVGGEIYDKAKKVPVVGNKIENATSNIANAASKIPGVDTASKIADKTGVLDKLNVGASQPEKTPTKQPVTNNKHNKGKLERRQDNNSTGINRFRRNNDFNPLIMGEYQTEMAEEDESDVVDGENIEDGEFNDSNEPKSITINPDTINNDVEYVDEEPKKGVIGTVTGVVKNVLNTRLLIIVGGIAFFVFLLFLVISGGAVDLDDNSAYVDTQCNYNETRVTVTNCYTSSSDKVEYETVDIKDYIIGAIYAYTYNDSYSDDTLKALMITLKTNALSYGSYSSSSKNVSLKSCSSEINYCSVTNGCNLKEENGVTTYEVVGGTEENASMDIPPISDDYKSKLESLYNEVSGYLYISSSYDSTIKRLSSRNALEFNESTIDMFEELASSGSNYTSILNTMYNVEEETDEGSEEEENKEESNTSKEEATSENTIVVGDSRTRGLLDHASDYELNNNNMVYAGGKGYDWFANSGDAGSNTNAVNGGIEKVNEILNNNQSKSYNIVLWLGFVDFPSLENGNFDSAAKKYVDKYVELANGSWSNHVLYVLPVGPVDDNKMASLGSNYNYYRNSNISEYNNKLKEHVASAGLNNLIYLDVDLEALNLYASDGMHYFDNRTTGENNDNNNIYSTMLEGINNSEYVSTELKLYNLTTYCQPYYGKSGCTSEYWWPLGVGEPDSNGVYQEPPTQYTRLSSYFGLRDAIPGTTHTGPNNHGGIDIPAPAGVPIVAALDGTVTLATYGNISYGNYVILQHANGTETLYAHATVLHVEVGDEVGQGQMIAEVGQTGNTSGNHLHFEVRVNGERVQPLDYVSADNLRPQCNNTSFDDGVLSLNKPTLSRSEFVSKMENYCTKTGHRGFCNNFSSMAGKIYDWGAQYNVNPELVVATAGREQGWTMCSSGNYNFFGFGISNGKGCSAHVITSMEDAIRQLGELYDEYTNGRYSSMITSRYNDRVAAGCDPGGYGLPGSFLGMLSIYGWIGNYRANPGSSGSGGCYYLKIIYGEDYALCGPSNTCRSVHGGAGCQKTTVCEQSDYTKYSAQVTLDFWNRVFGG